MTKDTDPESLRQELAEWQRVTGFDNPEALSLYLSRQTLLESDAATARVLAAALAARRAPVIPEVESLAASTDSTKCICLHEGVHHINHKGMCTAEGCPCMKLEPK